MKFPTPFQRRAQPFHRHPHLARATSGKYALKTGKLTRWTRSEVGGLDRERFVAPTLVRYPSTDGIEVPAFLYKPAQARAGGRFPVVVDLARRPRVAGAAALPHLRPGDGGPGGGGAAPQRPRLRRVRQGVPCRRRRGEAGAGAEGHRGHARLHRSPARPRRLTGGGLRRQLRRLHDPGLGGLLSRALPGGGGRGGDQQLLHLPRQHPALPAGSPPRGVRGRAEPGSPGGAGAHLSSELRGQDPRRALRAAGKERSPGAAERGGADRPGGARRRARTSGTFWRWRRATASRRRTPGTTPGRPGSTSSGRSWSVAERPRRGRP